MNMTNEEYNEYIKKKQPRSPLGMFVLRSASIFTRLKQNFRSGEQSSVSYETKPGTTGSRFNESGFFRKLCTRSAAGTERSRRR